MPDYALPGSGDTLAMTVAAIAYILSAAIGVVLAISGFLYLIGKKLARD